MSDAPNPSELFDLVFRGDILPGHQLAQVKQRMAQLFKIDEKRIEGLFSGRAVVLKRNLDGATANKYKTVLTKAGAEVQLKAAGKVVAKPKPSSVPKAQPESSVNQYQAISRPEQKKMTLSERLAAQAVKPKLPTAPEVPVAEGDIALAPVGTEVLRPEERCEVDSVDVDVSGIDLRPNTGLLLDANEYETKPEVALDLSAYELDDVGADLLSDSEKKPEPVSDFEIGNIELSPVGSDMGQEKKQTPPPPPDTSNIQLED